MTFNGDPTLIGWTTFTLYISAAGAAWRRSRAEQFDAFGRRAWRCIAVALLILGVNKEVDLHNVFLELFFPLTAAGKPPVALFRGLFAFVTLVFGGLAVRVLSDKQRLRRFAWPIAGLAFIAAYAFVRVCSLAQIDELYHLHWDKYPLFYSFEIIGTLLVIAGALSRPERQVIEPT